MAGILVQLLLILLLFTSDALNFMLDLTAALSLIPYLLAAGYALKLTLTRETYEDGDSPAGDMVIAALATVYTVFLVYAAGLSHLLLSCILYAPVRSFTSSPAANAACGCSAHAEAVLFAVIVIGAIAG